MFSTRIAVATGITIVLVSASLILGSSHLRTLEGAANGRGAVPCAMVSQCEMDLGRLTQGQMREISFPVRNAGGRRLVVSSENQACCGRSVDQPPLVLPPGGTAEIRIQVDTSGHCGQLRETYSYHTNDARRPRLSFVVHAEVVVPVPESVPSAGPRSPGPTGINSGLNSKRHRPQANSELSERGE